jgi:predicted RNase H-like nuclease
VFSPPIRPALGATSYAEAKVCNGGMTIQTWNIVARIAELDALVSPTSPVHEAHPELAFLRLSGGEPLPPKRTADGAEMRRALLVEHLPGSASILGQRPPRGAAADDVCDALVLCLTAARIATSTAGRVPDGPVATDARGLPMLVWW